MGLDASPAQSVVRGLFKHNAQLSVAESSYIAAGISAGLRTDGRKCSTFRDVVVETSVLVNALGSCRLKIASTDILVGVTADVSTPASCDPELLGSAGEDDERGCVEFSVDCAPMAASIGDERAGEHLSNELTQLLLRAYGPSVLSELTRSLLIVRGEHAWVLRVDVLVLALSGNIVDAVFLAVKAALASTRLPKTELIDLGDDCYDYEVSADETQGLAGVDMLPLCVTVNKIGQRHILDATPAEEIVSSAQLHVFATPADGITCVQKVGEGEIDPSLLSEMTQSARRMAVHMNKKLASALSLEQECENRAREEGKSITKLGFLA